MSKSSESELFDLEKAKTKINDFYEDKKTKVTFELKGSPRFVTDLSKPTASQTNQLKAIVQASKNAKALARNLGYFACNADEVSPGSDAFLLICNILKVVPLEVYRRSNAKVQAPAYGYPTYVEPNFGISSRKLIAQKLQSTYGNDFFPVFEGNEYKTYQPFSVIDRQLGSGTIGSGRLLRQVASEVLSSICRFYCNKSRLGISFFGRTHEKLAKFLIAKKYDLSQELVSYIQATIYYLDKEESIELMSCMKRLYNALLPHVQYILHESFKTIEEFLKSDEDDIEYYSEIVKVIQATNDLESSADTVLGYVARDDVDQEKKMLSF